MRKITTFNLSKDIKSVKQILIPRNFWVLGVDYLNGSISLTVISDNEEAFELIEYVILDHNSLFDYPNAIYLGSFEKAPLPITDTLSL